MLGYTEQELLAMTVKDISHPGDASATDELRDQLRSGAIQSFKTGETLSAQGRLGDLGRPHDRQQARPCGRVPLRHLGRRGHLRHARAPKSAFSTSRRTTVSRACRIARCSCSCSDYRIETARRYERKLAVLFIDLDRFKVINDTLGHEAGDVLLREMAARLRECLRASDVVARLGGDEFVVLLQDVNEPEQAAAVARNILSVVMKPVVILGQECRVTASIGVCLHPDDGQDDQSMMKNADMAMYLAKEEGKNNFQFFTSRMKPQSIERLSLETNLRRALERDEFSLHYQAKVNFKSGAITGVEALLRWHNPELGSVLAGAIHSARRGDGAHRADRQVGAADGLRAERRVAEARSAARVHVGEPVDAPARRRGPRRARSQSVLAETGHARRSCSSSRSPRA